MSDQRALLRESLVWSAPAALALAVLAAFGQVGLDAVVGGWLVSFLAGGWLARGRLRELHAIAVWIESLPRGQDRPGLPEQDGTVTSLLLRPVVELGRVLRRQSRSMAAQQRMLGTVIEAAARSRSSGQPRADRAPGQRGRTAELRGARTAGAPGSDPA
jgi:hypothetical protein